jgi:hypothetical protein
MYLGYICILRASYEGEWFGNKLYLGFHLMKGVFRKSDKPKILFEIWGVLKTSYV